MLLSEKNSETFELAAKQKILLPGELAQFSAKLKREGKTLATLNGSFDLLHIGHLDMIYQASKQADCLLVLLNSDASIQGYKGKDRPIQPLKVRLLHMAALAMVDYVSWFDELDPCNVLERAAPDVHVNGSEYGESCIEAETVKKGGGRLHLVHLIEGYSTTSLIQKIRGVSCD